MNWLGPSLADMLSTDVGQSAHLRTVSPDRLHQVLSDLHITPESNVDPTTLSRVAEFSSADTVVWGQYAKLGDQIRIDATVQDLKHDRAASLKTEASTQKDLSAAVDRLADSIRQSLALSPDILKELQAQSFKPTSSSIEALRDYNQGLELARQGKNLEAVKRLQAAVKEDPTVCPSLLPPGRNLRNARVRQRRRSGFTPGRRAQPATTAGGEVPDRSQSRSHRQGQQESY